MLNNTTCIQRLCGYHISLHAQHASCAYKQLQQLVLLFRKHIKKKKKEKDVGSPWMSCIKNQCSVLTLALWGKEMMLVLEDLSVLGSVQIPHRK